MALLSSLVRPLLPYIPGAPSIVLERQYLRAAREFFTKTRAYIRDDLTPVSAVADLDEYEIVTDAGEEVFDLLDLWYGEFPVTKETRRMSRNRRLTTPGIPQHFTIPNTNRLVVSPSPSSTGTEFTFLACTRPTIDATAIADTMIDKYMEVLDHGTIAFCLRQPKQEWTDYQGAAVYQMMFDDAITAHRSSAVDEEQRGVIRTVKYGGYTSK